MMMKYYNPITNKITTDPNIPNVINAKYDTIISHGWKEYIDVEPEYDTNTQYLSRGNIIVDGNIATQHYIINNNPVIVPDEISAAQGISFLMTLGLYNNVEDYVNNSDDEVLKVFWNRSSTWRINSPTISQLAMDLEVDLNQFFIEANKINI
jgi:hypothetical protein